MKIYSVMITYNESVTVQVNAESAKDAETKALKLAEYYGGSSYPEENKAYSKYTEYFTDPAEEITPTPTNPSPS
tara:strand:+ start:229 stop:450 length:222 start_codon:yes stop_codon:yes gene_type:complete